MTQGGGGLRKPAQRDEGVVAVAMKVLTAPGVQLQVVVDGLLDVLRQGDRSFAASFAGASLR